MRTSFSLLFTCLVAFTCLLTLNPTTVNARIHCGTTSDAPYDDCKALMDSKWEFNLQPICHSRGVIEVHNVACYQNCCVYVVKPNLNSKDESNVRKAATDLLRCHGAKSVNGLDTIVAGVEGVCIGDRMACGDCFDDKDFEFDT